MSSGISSAGPKLVESKSGSLEHLLFLREKSMLFNNQRRGETGRMKQRTLKTKVTDSSILVSSSFVRLNCSNSHLSAKAARINNMSSLSELEFNMIQYTKFIHPSEVRSTGRLLGVNIRSSDKRGMASNVRQVDLCDAPAANP